jgi:nitrogenase-associated protein
MARVTFYEKTGCAGNARQKALLAASGHEVLARDLRHKAWTNLALLEFFSGLPLAQWFNPSAPAVKSGEIVPAELDEPTALALLRDNPLLIRRPLLQVGDERRVGFDAAAIAAWIGLGDVPDENLEACRHGKDPTAGGCTP